MIEESIMQAALEILEEGFALYSLEIVPGRRETRIRVMLDKLDNPYGTPSLGDCERFSRSFNLRLDELESLGQIKGGYFLEVSSPGAERELKDSSQWERFKELSMRVQYYDAQEKVQTEILRFLKADQKSSVWEKIKKKIKKGARSKKRGPEEQLTLSIDQIKKVSLYIDF